MDAIIEMAKEWRLDGWQTVAGAWQLHRSDQ
jgi:hypothetical protein